MAKIEDRQVVLATKVLPPFEVVDYTKSIKVTVKTPQGDTFDINVAVDIIPNQKEYLKELKEQVAAVDEALLFEKADTIKLINEGKNE